MVQGPFPDQWIGPRVREWRRRMLPPQLEDGDVALNRDASRRDPNDFIAKEDGLNAVQEFHRSLQGIAFGVLHWSAILPRSLRLDMRTLNGV